MINSLNDEMQSDIENLQNKIKVKLETNQTEFFTAYKKKMAEVEIEMKMLKDKASDATIKANQDAKLLELEAERDWFR